MTVSKGLTDAGYLGTSVRLPAPGLSFVARRHSVEQVATDNGSPYDNAKDRSCGGKPYIYLLASLWRRCS
ncbi:hypothetical protein GALL_538480 [mine drainage metagenome]|uniref:Uncharacterized protein n=1 Tax=mine drainage metagenome TaxID=410659 RepID=A0A1J5P1W7_9ZZZZ